MLLLRHALLAPIVAVVLLIILVHVQYVMLRGKTSALDVYPSMPINRFPQCHSNGLRILSYNVHGLPFFWLRNHDRARALTAYLEEIAPEYDIICLQEVFSKTYRDALVAFFRSMGWSVATSKPPTFPHFVSAGLLMASRYPMKDARSTVFETCAIFDCFSTKGSLAADVEGVTVVNVHLQDATWDATGNTRRAQVHALRKAFSGPCVFVGDFNVEKNDAATVKEVGDALGKANYPDRPTFSKKTLDAAFGDSVQGVETVNPQHQTFVSDHLPIRVHVRQNST